MKSCINCEYKFTALGGESYCSNSDSPNYKFNDSGIYVLDVEKDICNMFEKIKSEQ
jgi:hypothetical protein